MYYVQFIIPLKVNLFWCAFGHVIDPRKKGWEGTISSGVCLAPGEPAQDPIGPLRAALCVDEVARHGVSQPVLGGNAVWAADPECEVWAAPGLTLSHVDPARLLVHKEHDGVEGGTIVYQGSRGGGIVVHVAERRHIFVVLVSGVHLQMGEELNWAPTLSPGTLVTTQWRNPRPWSWRREMPSSTAITV